MIREMPAEFLGTFVLIVSGIDVVAQTVLSKGGAGSILSGHNWWWVPIAAQLLGGVLDGWMYDVFVGHHLSEVRIQSAEVRSRSLKRSEVRGQECECTAQTLHRGRDNGRDDAGATWARSVGAGRGRHRDLAGGRTRAGQPR